MQSTDENGKVVRLNQIDLDNPSQLVAFIKQAENEGAVSHNIGRFPKAGDTIMINNLRYRVEFADYVKGKFTMKVICRDVGYAE